MVCTKAQKARTGDISRTALNITQQAPATCPLQPDQHAYDKLILVDLCANLLAAGTEQHGDGTAV